MLTLGQVKNSTVANIAGVNVNDAQFYGYVNDAVRMLMDLGDWWGSVVSMTGYVAQGCITWPKQIDAVLAMNINDRSVQISNQWYSFTPIRGTYAGLAQSYGCSCDDFISRWGTYGTQDSIIEFAGTQPMFDPPTPADPFRIQVTADNSADYGKTVTIYGQDENAQEIFATRDDGSTQRGVPFVLSQAGTISTQVFSTVTAVTKDITVSLVRAWKYTTATGRVCAIWSGGQTSPQFLFSRLANVPQNTTFCLSALVKLGFEPVTQDSDILPLGNLDAIKIMIQAIRKREAGDIDGSVNFEKDAIRRLNMELNSRLPVDQMPIVQEPFGSQYPVHRRIY
jgi:hypothetical protein